MKPATAIRMTGRERIQRQGLWEGAVGARLEERLRRFKTEPVAGAFALLPAGHERAGHRLEYMSLPMLSPDQARAVSWDWVCALVGQDSVPVDSPDRSGILSYAAPQSCTAMGSAGSLCSSVTTRMASPIIVSRIRWRSSPSWATAAWR